MKELVSVVVPVYEQVNFLNACLESIANQTYENLEVLLIDDGSKNKETEYVCRSFCKNDPRFFYKRIEHKGVSSARNEGIRMCSGKYVIFVDNDDAIDENRIKKCVDAMEASLDRGERNCFVLNGMEWMDDSSPISSQSVIFENMPDVFSIPQRELAVVLWKNLFNFVTNKMYKTDVIKEHNIFFHAEMNIAEDLVFNIDYMQADDGDILIVNQPLYKYIHRNENRLSLAYNSNALSNTKNAYGMLMQLGLDLELTMDHMNVIKSVYLYNWTARLSSIYKSDEISKAERKRLVNGEIRSSEFQEILDVCWKNKKISAVRYFTLKTKSFFLYFLLRQVYVKKLKSFFIFRGK